MSAVGETAVLPDAITRLTGADLAGWSAVPLLARGQRTSDPWVFVTGPASGWLSNGPLAEARFVPTTSDFASGWPFADGTLGGVVIDGDALAKQASDGVCTRILGEARRTVAEGGDILVVCGHRLLPRRVRAWREYGRRTSSRWQRAASSVGIDTCAAGFVLLDGARVVTVVPASTDREANRRTARDSDRRVFRLPASEGIDALSALADDASHATGVVLSVDRVAVRKIGKTAVFLSGANGERYIMRIARSPIALARARRNFEALEWFGRAPLPRDLRARVPAAVASGTRDGYAYFVETRLTGHPGPSAASRQTAGWELAAVRYLTLLHTACARPTTIEGDALTRLIRQPIAELADACHTRDAERVLARLQIAAESSLRGAVLPLVRAHGDFTQSNCLFDAAGALSAVVDWEVSAADGMPFVDLLQLMPVAGESSSNTHWLRFEAWLELWRRPDRLLADPAFAEYLDAMGLKPGTAAALALLYWVSYVSDRIDARRDDGRWMRQRVWQPLENLGRMLA